jgi:hypothetical protein
MTIGKGDNLAPLPYPSHQGRKREKTGEMRKKQYKNKWIPVFTGMTRRVWVPTCTGMTWRVWVPICTGRGGGEYEFPSSLE